MISNKIPKVIPQADPLFEDGRQDALLHMEQFVNRQIAFIKSILDEEENMAFSKEKRQGILLGYEQMKGRIQILKDFEKCKNIHASL